MRKTYKLCYIDPDEPKAYFTSDWKNQYGDDWDDRPYEHNAGTPYESYYEDHKEFPIELKKVFFEIPWGWEMPCSNVTNSRYSVEDINNNRVPWIIKDGEYIFAGTSYTEFIKKIEKWGGTVYLPKKKGKTDEEEKC